MTDRKQNASLKFASCVSALLFAAVWAITTYITLRQTTIDVDLGIAPSSLPVWQSAVWSLPLALVIWVCVIAVAKLIRYLKDVSGS